MLCLPDNNVDKYRGIKVWHLSSNPKSWDDPNLIDLYDNLQPMIFSSPSATGRGFDARFGLCVPLEGKPIVVVYWSSLDQSLNMHVALRENPEAPINSVLSEKLQPAVQVAQLTIDELRITKFYAGRTSKYANDYPDELKLDDGLRFYDKSICLDRCFER